jgi:CO dehydrogenase maturation factor
MGGVSQAGGGCLCPEYTLLAAIFRHMRLLPDEVVVLDTPAGMEHFGRAVADGFSCALVVTDPSYNAMAVARDSAGFAKQLGIQDIILVVNKAGSQEENDKIREKMCGFSGFSHMIFLPCDPEIIHLEPAVNRLISGNGELIRAVRILEKIVTDQTSR